MTIPLEQKIEQETWEVLKQIKRDFLLTPKNRYVTYEVTKQEENADYPFEDDQRKIIARLESMGAFSIHKRNYLSYQASALDSDFFAEVKGAKPKGYLLNVDAEKFNPIFSEYEKRFAGQETKKDNAEYYVIKKLGQFRYKGSVIDIDQNTNIYKIFDALYTLLPNGGQVDYPKLCEEVKSRIPALKELDTLSLIKVIQTNLTDRSNGIMRKMKAPKTESNSKPLIRPIRGKGIEFNNKIV